VEYGQLCTASWSTAELVRQRRHGPSRDVTRDSANGRRVRCHRQAGRLPCISLGDSFQYVSERRLPRRYRWQLVSHAHGSVLGRMLYTVFVAAVGRLISGYGVHYREYADDTQLFTKVSVPCSDGRHWLTVRMCRRTAILVLEQCTVIESKQVCRCTFRHTWPIEEFHLTITDISSWLYSRCCRQSVYTGSYTRQHILFDRHVNNVVKNCTYHLHALRRIRASLPMKSLTCWPFPLLVFELTIVTLFFGMAAKN